MKDKLKEVLVFVGQKDVFEINLLGDVQEMEKNLMIIQYRLWSDKHYNIGDINWQKKMQMHM